MKNTYIANREKAIGRASKITGVPRETIKEFYRNFNGADNKTKQALIYAYDIMHKYAAAAKKKAEAEVPAVEEA